MVPRTAETHTENEFRVSEFWVSEFRNEGFEACRTLSKIPGTGAEAEIWFWAE